jgi:hypothetical protein
MDPTMADLHALSGESVLGHAVLCCAAPYVLFADRVLLLSVPPSASPWAAGVVSRHHHHHYTCLQQVDRA